MWVEFVVGSCLAARVFLQVFLIPKILYLMFINYKIVNHHDIVILFSIFLSYSIMLYGNSN